MNFIYRLGLYLAIAGVFAFFAVRLFNPDVNSFLVGCACSSICVIVANCIFHKKG